MQLTWPLKLTILTILKSKDTTKGTDVAKEVMVLITQKTQVLEEVENLLLVWLNKKLLAGDSFSEAMVCEKSGKLHSDLLQENHFTIATSDASKVSRHWFYKFHI